MELFELYYEYLPRQAIEDLTKGGSCDFSAQHWAKRLKIASLYSKEDMRLAIAPYGIEDTDKMSKKTLAEYCVWLAAGLDEQEREFETAIAQAYLYGTKNARKLIRQCDICKKNMRKLKKVMDY